MSKNCDKHYTDGACDYCNDRHYCPVWKRRMEALRELRERENNRWGPFERAAYERSLQEQQDSWK